MKTQNDGDKRQHNTGLITNIARGTGTRNKRYNQLPTHIQIKHKTGTQTRHRTPYNYTHMNKTSQHKQNQDNMKPQKKQYETTHLFTNKT